jgi:hypothetical protein
MRAVSYRGTSMRFTLACATLIFVSNQAIASDVDTTSTRREAAPKIHSIDRGNMNGMAQAAAAADDDGLANPHAVPMPIEISRQELCEVMIMVARGYGLPVGFFARLIWQESGFRTQIVSSAGAQGIAQFMPGVAAEKGLEDPFDPMQALPASAEFLRELHRQFGNHGLAAAAYNAGPGRVSRWLAKRGKLPNETRSYVFIITGQQPEQWVGTKKTVANFATVPAGTQCQVREAAAPTAPVAQTVRWSRPISRARVIRARLESPVPQVSTPVAEVFRPDVY